MHVRVRIFGKPDVIVLVESKLTKIEYFRRLVKDKCNIEPNLQRLFYGGKLLENGYTFHDYNIKLNDVIQVLVRPKSNDSKENTVKKTDDIKQQEEKIVYEDAESNLYTINDLVDMKDREQGAWFEGKIVEIVRDPQYVRLEAMTNGISNSEDNVSTHSKETDNGDACTDMKRHSDVDEKNVLCITPSKKNGIMNYFKKYPINVKKQLCDDNSRDENIENLKTDIGLLYKIQLDADENEPKTDYYCKLNEIRPRARKVIEIKDLKVGQKVMINHNTEDLLQKGYWYDFTIAEIKKLRTTYELIGTLFLGLEEIPQNDTRVKIHDKIFDIEEVVPLCDRSAEYKELMVTQTERRSQPLNCLKCRDDEEMPCRECGCYLCLGKEGPENIILCDECNNGYHMACLDPPLTSLPEEDWYCPSCKRDPNQVVAPGAAKQAKKSTISNTKRDWGRGMACAGKTKTCAMPPNHFGPIPGIEVGMTWRFRIQLSESGVHRPPVSGIHGRDVEGAYSLVLSGGYEDDVDDGEEFTYTGSGGRDLSGNKRTAEQSTDQTLTRENKALARNCAVKTINENGGDAGKDWRAGKPVRVVRSYKMLKHFPQYAPPEGIRYDGIYKVVKYYPETGKSGYKVWKYLLRRDDPNPAPWERGAKQYPVIYPDGYLEAEAEKKAQRVSGSVKKPKKSSKRALRESNGVPESDDSVNVDKSPPQKKRKTRSSINTTDQDSKKTKNNSKGSPNNKKSKLFSPKRKNGLSPKKENHMAPVLNDEELAMIAADTLNSKLWKECLEISKKNGKQQFVEHVTQLFLCIICQEVAANPVTTKCHHNFCASCLKLAFKSTGTKNCPCCRQKLSEDELSTNEDLKKALQTIMPGYDVGKK